MEEFEINALLELAKDERLAPEEAAILDNIANGVFYVNPEGVFFDPRHEHGAHC